MNESIQVGLVAGAVALTGSLITYLGVLRTLSEQRRRFDDEKGTRAAELERIQQEVSKLKEESASINERRFSELQFLTAQIDRLNQETRHQERKADLEMERLQREVHKLQVEASLVSANTFKAELEAHQIRIVEPQALRDKLAEVLSLFDRGVFHAGMCREEPVAMYEALTATRRSLQDGRHLTLADRRSAPIIERLHAVIAQKQDEVAERFPWLLRAASELRNIDEYQRRERIISEYDGARDSFWDAVRNLMELRSEIYPLLSQLKSRLSELDDQLAFKGEDSERIQ